MWRSSGPTSEASPDLAPLGPPGVSPASSQSFRGRGGVVPARRCLGDIGQENLQAPSRGLGNRVLRSQALFIDLDRAPYQRLGLFQTVGVVEQLGQVVESESDFWVFVSEGGLADGECAPHQRLGLLQTVCALEQHGQ